MFNVFTLPLQKEQKKRSLKNQIFFIFKIKCVYLQCRKVL